MKGKTLRSTERLIKILDLLQCGISRYVRVRLRYSINALLRSNFCGKEGLNWPLSIFVMQWRRKMGFVQEFCIDTGILQSFLKIVRRFSEEQMISYP